MPTGPLRPRRPRPARRPPLGDGLRTPRGRTRAAAAAAVLLVAAAAGAALSDRGAGVARVSVRPAAPGAVVPRSFLGLSTEWTSVEPFGGAARGGVVTLLRRVAAAARAPLALRIGGASAEEAWWNPGGRRARPPTIRHDVGPRTLGAVAALARGLDAPVTLGLDLQLGRPRNALALARAAQRRLGGRLDALEAGNEPDLYASARDIGPPAVRRLRKRDRYTPDDYVRDAGRFLDVVAPGLRRPPRLVVGGFAGTAWATTALPTLIDSRRRRMGAVSAHLYALPGCDLRADAAALRRRLLAPSASRGRADALAPIVAVAHHRGLPLRVAELNSVPCGGAPGVSDTFAAALWLTDTLFALLRAGADGADVHTWDGAVYAPFARAAGAIVEPRAPFYGMLAFARAAPAGSRLVPVRVQGRADVRAWATRDRRGTVRVALLAATDARRVRVRLAVAPGRACATLQVTTAPSIAARTGILDAPGERRCPRGRTLGLTVPGPSIGVLELPGRA